MIFVLTQQKKHCLKKVSDLVFNHQTNFRTMLEIIQTLEELRLNKLVGISNVNIFYDNLICTNHYLCK